MKGKFWDDTTVNKRNLLKKLREYASGPKTGDVSREFDTAVDFLAAGEYCGWEEDIDFILEKLEDRYNVNLQDVDDILRQGGYSEGWYFSKIIREG